MDLLIPTPRLQNQPSGRRAMESRYRWGSPVGKIFLKQNVYGYASYPPPPKVTPHSIRAYLLVSLNKALFNPLFLRGLCLGGG